MGLSTKKTSTSSSTTPDISDPYAGYFEGFAGDINNFLATDPTQYVAPESQLQQSAFQQAQNLGGWETYLNQSRNLAQSAANAPASQVTPYGYSAPQIGGAYTLGGTQLDPAAQFGGAQLGDATQMQAAQLGAAQGYNAPQLGDAALASSQGLLGDPTRLLQYMNDYQNPYTQQVIDATLADYDEQAGQQRAALDARGAIGGAFGGSRFGIAEGQLEGELARGRASTQAALLDQQYRLAAQLAGVDAGAANQFAMQNADMGFNASLANQQAQNTFALSQAGYDADSARYLADANNQFALTQSGYDQQAGLANMDAANQFAMQQGLLDQQTGLANMDATNQFSMQQGLLDQQTDMANADTLNNFLMTQYGMNADAARYYADALNQGSFANANLLEQSYLRDLQASGQLGDLSQLYGQQSLADTSLTAQLGDMQRSIESEELNAVPTQLQLAGNLYSQLYPGLYAGTDSSTTGKTGGMGSWLPQLAGSAMQAGAIAFSDRRLKTNIELVKRDPDGLGWYGWNWRSDPNGPREYGVIADEVKDLRPWAYVENYRDGYDGVNYAKLEEIDGR